jgi:hypothetical protein
MDGRRPSRIYEYQFKPAYEGLISADPDVSPGCTGVSEDLGALLSAAKQG